MTDENRVILEDFSRSYISDVQVKRPGKALQRLGPLLDGLASSADPRFAGIERTDLRAKYGAPLDGASHPLAVVYGTQGLALAQGFYPSAGITSGNFATMELDTAAWLQAESDLRLGPGGIIGLPDEALMMVSQQLWLQNAAKVWFHGGRGSKVFTVGTGTVPAVRISHADQYLQSVPMSDLSFFAKANPVYTSATAGGVAHTGFAVGSQAFQLDDVQGATFPRVCWNGYDQPFLWGNNVFGVTWREFCATGNNAGVNWGQTSGLNSGERIRFVEGSSSNNNIGFDINMTFSGGPNQGGSFFVQGNAIDYNIVRHVRYIGMAVGTYTGVNEAHFIGNHIETTGACSGSALCRIFAQGTPFFTDNAFFENDATRPAGFVEVADFCAASFLSNRMNSDTMPMAWSGSAAPKRVNGFGNVSQSPNLPLVLLSDTTGSYLQPDRSDGSRLLLFADQNPPLPLALSKNNLLLNYYQGAGNLTLPSDAQSPIPIGTVIPFRCISNTVTFVVPAGVTLDTPTNGPKAPNGSFGTAIKHDNNHWILVGTGLTA